MTSFIMQWMTRGAQWYPLAHNSGANFIEALLMNLDGKANVPVVGSFKEGVQMFKYVDAVFIDGEGLLR